MSADDLLTGLPGEELVRRGLEDLQAGRTTVWAYLVALAAPRLRRVGLIEPSLRPEHRY